MVPYLLFVLKSSQLKALKTKSDPRHQILTFLTRLPGDHPWYWRPGLCNGARDLRALSGGFLYILISFEPR